GAIGKALQEVRRGDEIRPRFRLIELGEELARLVFVAGIAAQRIEPVRRERDEIVDGKTPRDILDVRIEPAILVYDEDSGKLSGRVRSLHEIPAHRSRALRRCVLDVARADPLVVLGNLLRE